METCITRGFSNTFVNSKLEKGEFEEAFKADDNLELEITWKATQRQRRKAREDKIWNSFVKEQEDLLNYVIKEDAYQFIDAIPESQLTELIVELNNSRDEKNNEEKEMQQQQEEEHKETQNADNFERPKEQEVQNSEYQKIHENQKIHKVTFADNKPAPFETKPAIETDGENSKDDCSELETTCESSETIVGPETYFGSFTVLSTVREKDPEPTEHNDKPKDNEQKQADEPKDRDTEEKRTVNRKRSGEKSKINRKDSALKQIPTEDHATSPRSSASLSEGPQSGIRALAENSTYNARIKETRAKLKDELKFLIKTVDNMNFSELDAGEMRCRLARTAEFCNRFQRIYLYQVHRQMYDIQRHNSLSLPYAKNTHYQAQMMRAVSLHQNLLQAFQVFHKAIASTGCVREGADMLTTLIATAREVGALCQACATPPHLANAVNYNDLNTTLDSLELAKKLQEERALPLLENVIMHNNKIMMSVREMEKGKRKKKQSVYHTAKAAHHAPKGRLSMYEYSGDAKVSGRRSATTPGQSSRFDSVRVPRNKKVDLTPKNKEIPVAVVSVKMKQNRRPLMRNPQTGKPRRRQLKGGEAVTTLVEAVHSESNHSGIDSPIIELRHIYNEGFKSEQTSPQRSPHTWRGSARPLPAHSPRAGRAKPTPPPPSPSYPPPQPQRVAPGARKVPDDTGMPSSARKLMIDKSPAFTNLGISPRSSAATSIYEVYQVQMPKKMKDALNKIQGSKNGFSYPPDSPVPAPVTREAKATSPLPFEEDSKMANGSAKKPKKNENEVSILLRQLCSSENKQVKTGRTSGAKNAQLVCINSSQPNTPHLLKILEETIQKKSPHASWSTKNDQGELERKYRLALDVGDDVTERTFQYRTKFVQHMLTSSMYANSSVDKPWQVIGTIADEILDDLLLFCAKEMEINDIVKELYDTETRF